MRPLLLAAAMRRGVPNVTRRCFALWLGCTALGSAQSVPFIGNGGAPLAVKTGTWATPAHWDGNAVPPSAAETSLVFGASDTAYTATQDLGTTFTMGEISFNSPNAITINGTSGLEFGGDIATIYQDGVGAVTISSAINMLSDTTVLVAGGAGTLTLSGPISGLVEGYEQRFLFKAGEGTLLLNGSTANSVTAVIVVEGELHLNKTPGQFATSGSLAVEDGATAKFLAAGQLDPEGNVALSGRLDVHGLTTTIGYLSDSKSFGTGEIALGGGTLTINQSYSEGFSGRITGNGAVVKEGDGELVLGGASTYTGGTTVNTGGLIALNAVDPDTGTAGSATGTGSLLISENAMLGGSGFIVPIGGNVTVNGTLYPGGFDSDVLTFGSATQSTTVILGDTSLLLLDICDCGESTSIAVFGQLQIQTGATLDVFSAIETLSGTYTLATYSSLTGAGVFGNVVFNNDPIADAFLPNAFGGTHQLVYGTNAITLAPSAIPEPSTYAALVGALVLGVTVWRRRAASRSV